MTDETKDAPVNLRVPQSLLDEVDDAAAAVGVSRSEFIRDALSVAAKREPATVALGRLQRELRNMRKEFDFFRSKMIHMQSQYRLQITEFVKGQNASMEQEIKRDYTTPIGGDYDE